jgi:endonuclease/exonuclease/phosphatase (EEP) superfamily protein YafD
LRFGLIWLGIGLLLVALPLRHWVLTGLLFVTLVLNATVVLTSFGASSHEPPHAPITLLHANVWAGNRSMGGFDAMARAQNPHIVVVLERYYFQGYDWADHLADILPYRLDCAEADCGNNVLSRWPLERLGVVTSPWHDGLERPSYLAARVHRPEGAFTLVTAHLGQPFNQPVQDAQVEWLLARLAELPPPIILSGDFNAAPWSPLMRRLMARGALSRLSNTGPTWPSWGLPIGIPIDHVLAGDGVGGAGWQVLGDIGSDHRPVLGHFTLPVVTR